MTKIEWDEQFSIGIKSIDEEHKMLIEHLNAVSEAMDKHLDESTIVKTLDFLLDYTNFHFTNEEQYIINHGCPGLEVQQKQHAEFKKTVHEIILIFQQDSADRDIATDIYDLLFTWLKKHIMEVDHKLAQYEKE